MTSTDWVAILAGAAAIAWVQWYFFVAGRRRIADVTATAGGSGATPSIDVVVDGGYEPATIRVPAGKPVRLVFDRRDRSSCAEEVVFPDFGIKKYLPLGEKVSIELTPPSPGRYEFMCGMSMLRGSLIADAQG